MARRAQIRRGPRRRRRSGSTGGGQLQLRSRSKGCSAGDTGQAHNAVERNGEVNVLAGRKRADDNRQGTCLGIDEDASTGTGGKRRGELQEAVAGTGSGHLVGSADRADHA